MCNDQSALFIVALLWQKEDFPYTKSSSMGMTNTQKQFSGAVGLLYMIFYLMLLRPAKRKQYPLQKKGALGLETWHYWKTLVTILWFLNVSDLKQ